MYIVNINGEYSIVLSVLCWLVAKAGSGVLQFRISIRNHHHEFTIFIERIFCY
jgi:hypothetical protein